MDLQWTSDLSVGVDEIDDQHKELFQRLNNLRIAMGQGKSRAEIGKTVKFLQDYVVEHFATEERHMGRYGYPAFGAHKAEHEAFIKDFSAFKKKLENIEIHGGITSFLAIEMQRRLYDWLINHIGRIDKALGNYLVDVM
jgi:hemerythrin